MSETVYRAPPAPADAERLDFTKSEWLRLAGLYGFIAVLHVVGGGLYLHYAADHPSLIGLGFAAYMFGLRHAFDADHIAAIDDTVRLMLQRGERPLGVGFFFSLGHSTIVLVLAVAIAIAASAIVTRIPAFKDIGSLIGASVSGVFLWIIGVLNVFVLLDILGVWRLAKSGTHSHAHLDEVLARRGFLNRLFGGRFNQVMKRSWQMYPLGLLFGLGFDTASEVALMVLTAGAAAGNLPWPAILSLPILFAAGMTLMDTTDGVLMSKAYAWAFANPLRKIFYNLTTTALAIIVALVIGTIELVQVFIRLLELEGPMAGAIAGLDFGVLGYVIVGLFLLAWGASVVLWRFGRFEERYEQPVSMHLHAHTHADGKRHSHEHVH